MMTMTMTMTMMTMMMMHARATFDRCARKGEVLTNYIQNDTQNVDDSCFY